MKNIYPWNLRQNFSSVFNKTKKIFSLGFEDKRTDNVNSSVAYLLRTLPAGGHELRYLYPGPGRIGISGGFTSANGIFTLKAMTLLVKIGCLLN